MPATHLFEYAVIRVVPRVDREEFLNVGVILDCPCLKFLGLRCTQTDRLLTPRPEARPRRAQPPPPRAQCDHPWRR